VEKNQPPASLSFGRDQDRPAIRGKSELESPGPHYRPVPRFHREGSRPFAGSRRRGKSRGPETAVGNGLPNLPGLPDRKTPERGKFHRLP